MQALIHTQKAQQTPDGWMHDGNKVAELGDMDMFVLEARDPETGNPIVCFMLDRTTLEKIGMGIQDALENDPIVIRCLS